MTNIDKFDYYCGVLFANLYESFPMPIDSVAIDELQDKDDSEIVFYMFVWLENNDLITCNGTDQDFYSVVPTLKGLSLLKMLPSSLDANKSFGEALTGAVKDKAPDLVVELMKSFFIAT